MDSRSTVTSKMGVQKIGKETSSVLPKVKDASFNLRDKLNDVLISEKYMLHGYRVGSNEIIDAELLGVVMNNIQNLKNIQRNCFEQLFDLGEYQADVATPPQIADTVRIFSNYKVQFPYQQVQQ